MNDPSPSPDPDQRTQTNGAPSTTLPTACLREQLLTSLLSVLILTVLTGVLFPLTLLVITRIFFPTQANGSLLKREGVVIGSELIGQNFANVGYFHGRPSAAGAGYDGASSGGTNLGPNNPKLREGTPDDPATPAVDESFVGVQRLSEEYRKINGVAPGTLIPIDAVTRSGSGLDPHISPANAALQIPRVARARSISEFSVRTLVAKHTIGRQFGFLGEPRVSVLPLNLELDEMAPLIKARRAAPAEAR